MLMQSSQPFAETTYMVGTDIIIFWLLKEALASIKVTNESEL
jgi:hypothetical protein